MVQRERSRRTRSRIIDAAFALFAERGWEGTTIAAVAKAAPVATQTVYFSFGSKAALLREVIVAKRTAPGESSEVVKREWFVEAMAAVGQRRGLALGVEGGTEVLRRLSPIAHALTSAELVDDEFATVMKQIRSERRAGMGRLAETLASRGGLAAATMTVTDLTDVLDVVQSMGTYHAFVAGCGWSPERYKAWAFRTVSQMLSATPPTRARKLDLAATADLSYHEELAKLLSP